MVSKFRPFRAASVPPGQVQGRRGRPVCRVGACLASFKDPRVCMKHCARHFPLAWQCPGPYQTRTANRGRFACDETLKRHLLFPSYASCKDAVLRLLGLDSIPASGCGTGVWIVPLRDSPERPWERPGFHLTDLETVKELLCQREHLHARLHVVVIPAPTPQRNRTCTFSRSKWTKMRRQSRS